MKESGRGGCEMFMDTTEITLFTSFLRNEYVDEQSNAYDEVKNKQRPPSAEPTQLQPADQLIRQKNSKTKQYKFS